MHTDFQLAKARLLERLITAYGPQWFEQIWMDEAPLYPRSGRTGRCTAGRNAFLHQTAGADVAWHKTVRKMKINILQYLNSGHVQDFVWATAYVSIYSFVCLFV